jgi:hypothetical protein
LGFILLVFGTLVYNEIVVLPFWGFNENTRATMLDKEDDQDFQNLLKDFTSR